MAVGVIAAFAPATLTGHPVIDVMERAVFAAGVSYLGSHGRRWSWLVAVAGVALAARGPALVLALLGTAVLVASFIPRRRLRAAGAVGLGLLALAVLWYPAGTSPAGVALALVGLAIPAATGLQYVRSPRRQVARGAIIGLGVVAVLAALLASIAVLLAYGSVQAGSDDAQRALDAARAGEPEAAARALADADAAFARASDRLGGPLGVPASAVPFLSQQLDAVQVTVEQGRLIAASADDLVATADYDSLQYEGALDLDQVEALTGPAQQVDAVLTEADAAVDDVRAGVLLPPLRDGLDEFDARIAEARDDAALATTLLEVAPGLFGGDGPRRYLIIFITPAELRGAGGFIGSYAELTAVDGKVELSRSGRIIDLILAAEPGQRTISGPQDYLDRYGRFRPEDFLQDVTFSPHFPSSASVIAELYPQSGGEPVDGVIGVDPTGLAALLELTGPVEVEGLDEPLDADNAVEVLTRTQYLEVPDDAERGEILTEATRATFDELVSMSLPAPRELADVLSPAARAGHLRMWSPVDEEQGAFELVGADGRLEIPDGADGFAVVQQNAGNNKLDAYLQRSITYEPRVDVSSGALTATMRIELRNEVPSLDLPLPVVGNARGAPAGTNIAWFTVFTPHVVTSATIDGEPMVSGGSVEQGLNGWNTPLIEIPPGGEVVIELELAGGLDLSDGYALQVLPQPVANPDEMRVDLTVLGGTVSGTGSLTAELLGGEPVVAPTRFDVGIDG